MDKKIDSIIDSLKDACLKISDKISNNNPLNMSDIVSTNESNDDVKKLDILSNDLVIESLSKNKDVHVSIGVGININIPESYSIDQPHSNLSKNINCAKLIYNFCKNIINNLNSKNKDEIVKRFNANLFGYKEQVQIIDNNNSFIGELMGINNNGELVIKNDEKTIFIDDINSTIRLL